MISIDDLGGHCAWQYHWKYLEDPMASSQTRAIQNYRSRLSDRGLARFEVLGRDSDRILIRSACAQIGRRWPNCALL